MKLEIEIHEYTQHQCQELDFSEFELWWDNWDEALIRRSWVAFDGDLVVGFLTIDGDFNCVAVEVLPQYRRQGIGRELCEEANTFTPREDYKPEFWGGMRELCEVA